jgi:hypothetical protein
MTRTVTVRGVGKFLTEDAAREEFGLTESPADAGFLLSNGDMLDFSEGGGIGRTLDHRAIVEETDDAYKDARSYLVWRFCEQHDAVRLNVSRGSVNADIVSPKGKKFGFGLTATQIERLIEIIQWVAGDGEAQVIIEGWARRLGGNKFGRVSYDRIAELSTEYVAGDDVFELREMIKQLNREYIG